MALTDEALAMEIQNHDETPQVRSPRPPLPPAGGTPVIGAPACHPRHAQDGQLI